MATHISYKSRNVPGSISHALFSCTYMASTSTSLFPLPFSAWLIRISNCKNFLLVPLFSSVELLSKMLYSKSVMEGGKHAELEEVCRSFI